MTLLPALDPDAPAALLRRAHAGIAAGDLATVLGCFTADATFECIGTPPHLPYCGQYRGHDGLREYLRRVAAAAEVLDFEVAEVAAAGPGRLLATGRERLRFRTTGLEAEGRWVHLFTLDGCRIATATQWRDTAAQLVAYRGY